MTEIDFIGGWLPSSVDKRHLHAQRYSMDVLIPRVTASVERITAIPPEYKAWYYQGNKNACVGASTTMLQAIMNYAQYGAVRYDWWKHYCLACQIDENKQTSCAADIGTFEWAGLQVLHEYGAFEYGKDWNLEHGLDKYVWAKSADEGRTAIAEGQLIGIGSPWFQEFMPEYLEKDGAGRWWIRNHKRWTRSLGGHAYGIVDALDSVDGFGRTNTWADSYPEKVYMHYDDHNYLTSLGTECAVLIDKKYQPPAPEPNGHRVVEQFVLQEGGEWWQAVNVEMEQGK